MCGILYLTQVGDCIVCLSHDFVPEQAVVKSSSTEY